MKLINVDLINRKLVLMLILFVGFETALAQSINIFTDFESLYSIDYKRRGLVLGHIDNMTYLYDEFEDRYEVFPNEEYYMQEKESMKNGLWYSYAAASYSSYSEEFVGYIYLFQSIKPTIQMNGMIRTNFLISGERKEMSISTISDATRTIIAIRIPSDEWLEFYNSYDVRYRLNDEVRYIGTEAKSLINNTLKVLYDIKTNKYESENDAPNNTTISDNSNQYEIKWEGDIERLPLAQPLPTNITNSNAVTTVRFEVRPNGTVGLIIPLRKMNAELETEILRTLRSWRFNRLPNGVPQQPQWGTITFRFITD